VGLAGAAVVEAPFMAGGAVVDPATAAAGGGDGQVGPAQPGDCRGPVRSGRSYGPRRDRATQAWFTAWDASMGISVISITSLPSQ
jgi:hypothetical protein